MNNQGAIVSQADISSLLSKQRSFFRSGATLDVNWRVEQLKKLKEAVLYYRKDLEEAMAEDLSRSPMEAYFCDIGTVLLELNEALRGLRKWAKPERQFSGLLCFPSLTTKVFKMPYGSVLIISPFNFPVFLSLGVLIPAIAAGNTALIKASSKSIASTAVLEKLIARAFPPEYVAIVGGNHVVADYCLDAGFDKIFYTGSPRIGAHVLAKAAKNLTPVALELGGETGNWCVVRKDADLRDAARKIAFFKILNAGQICININQVAVAQEVSEQFIDLLKGEFIRQIGETALGNPEYPCLISSDAYNKCLSDADKYRDRVVFGGNGDAESRKFSPTIIFPVGIDEEIVQRELFCPLLPVVPFEDSQADALIQTIEQREHGLSFYLFTKDLSWAESTISKMQFGGGCVNEVIMHLMVKGAPFNGTGHSGMGAYHGEWGFREFSHPKTVLYGSNHLNLSLREHPYTGRGSSFKRWLLEHLER